MTHILVATLGTTPQVLTEAFYYYHRHLGITFDEIHVFTTSRGADELRRVVFGRKGAFARMCRHLRVRQGSVKFGPHTVHVMLGADGAPIEDLRTTGDGDAVADQILTVMRHVCDDPHTTVHAIASGGRKVMSIYLHAMMQLVGRPQDKLFHILVHPALEAEIVRQRRLDFFYPNGPIRIGRLTIPEDEVLAYIEIPLLNIAPRDSLNRDVPYTQMARERQQEVRRTVTPPTLTIDPQRREIRVDEISIALTPDEFFGTTRRRASRLRTADACRSAISTQPFSLRLAEDFSSPRIRKTPLGSTMCCTDCRLIIASCFPTAATTSSGSSEPT